MGVDEGSLQQVLIYRSDDITMIYGTYLPVTSACDVCSSHYILHL